MSRCSHNSLSVRPSCACSRSRSLRRLGSAKALKSKSVSWRSAMFYTQVITCLNNRQVSPCMSSTHRRSPARQLCEAPVLARPLERQPYWVEFRVGFSPARLGNQNLGPSGSAPLRSDEQFCLEQYVVIANSISGLLGQLSPPRKLRPCGHGTPHFGKQPGDGANLETVSQDQQVLTLDVTELPVHRHQMLVGPFPLRVVRVDQVVGRSELPIPLLTQ